MAGETELLRVTPPPQRRFVHHKSRLAFPESNPGFPCERPATDSLRRGTASFCLQHSSKLYIEIQLLPVEENSSCALERPTSYSIYCIIYCMSPDNSVRCLTASLTILVRFPVGIDPIHRVGEAPPPVIKLVICRMYGVCIHSLYVPPCFGALAQVKHLQLF